MSLTGHRGMPSATGGQSTIRSINTAATPAVAFEPNYLWASPILPSRKSKCHQPVGAEVFDTTTDPAIELPVCSRGIKHILTYKLVVGRFVLVPSVPKSAGLCRTLERRWHTEAVSDRSLAHRSDRPAAIEECRQSDFGVNASNTERCVILMARDFPANVHGWM